MADMTKKELLAFVEQILVRSTDWQQKDLVLRQFVDILTEEQTDEQLVAQVLEVIDLRQDMEQEMQKAGWTLNENAIEIAKQRKEQRLVWERAQMNHGRCC